MTPIRELFADYAVHHRTAGNKLFHRLGIPLIVFSLIGLLEHVRLGAVAGQVIDAGIVLIALSEIYYLVLEWRLGLAMLLVSAAFYFLARLLPSWALWTLFILGWIFQFIGHSVYEKRQPAFLKNFVHLFIGPLWILNGLVPIVDIPA